MRVILNILWLVLSGFWLALGYLAASAEVVHAVEPAGESRDRGPGRRP